MGGPVGGALSPSALSRSASDPTALSHRGSEGLASPPGSLAGETPLRAPLPPPGALQGVEGSAASSEGALALAAEWATAHKLALRAAISGHAVAGPSADGESSDEGYGDYEEEEEEEECGETYVEEEGGRGGRDGEGSGHGPDRRAARYDARGRRRREGYSSGEGSDGEDGPWLR